MNPGSRAGGWGIALLVCAGSAAAYTAIDPAAWNAREPELLGRLPAIAGLTLVFAAAAWRAGHVDFPGALAGLLLATALGAGAGWGAYLLFVVFFTLGTAATRYGHDVKAARRVAQDDGGRRSVRHAVANTAVPAFLALLAAGAPDPGPYLLGIAGGLATATFDTVSAEVGQVLGRRTILITTGRPVPIGTEGAVSAEGTLAGLAGASLIAAAAAATGMTSPPGGLVVVGAAVAGGMAESFLGAWTRTRGRLGNESLNFLNTAVGAGLCLLVGLGTGG